MLIAKLHFQLCMQFQLDYSAVFWLIPLPHMPTGEDHDRIKTWRMMIVIISRGKISRGLRLLHWPLKWNYEIMKDLLFFFFLNNLENFYIKRLHFGWLHSWWSITLLLNWKNLQWEFSLCSWMLPRWEKKNRGSSKRLWWIPCQKWFMRLG